MIEFDSETILNLLANTDNALMAVNTEGTVEFVNEPFCVLLKANEAYVLNSSVYDWIDESIQKPFASILTHIDLNTRIKDYDIVLRSSENKPVNFLMSAQFIVVEGSKCLLLIGKNVTKQRQAVQKLRDAKQRAEQSDSLKTAFLANLSHEIRTPMNAILGFSEMLLSKNISDEQRKSYIDYITNSGSMLLNLIDDIIDIAKIQSGQLVVKYELHNINHLLFEIYNSYEKIIKTTKGDAVRLNWVRSKQYDNIRLNTDPLRLRQVFTNLLSNALKFTESGSIEFGYILDVEDADGEEVIKFFVRDTGIGVPIKNQEMIFDRFYKIEENSHRLYRGAGLGLAITKSMVELLGGKISLSSIQGKGSEFSFTFPYSEVSIVGSNKKIKEQGDADALLSGITVLVAEDEELNSILITELLRKYNTTVYTAVNGQQAVELFKEHADEIDVVLLDIKMPIMDGYEAISEIRKMSSSVPVIAQTAYAFSSEREKILNSGFNDYISKPIKQMHFYDILAKNLK